MDASAPAAWMNLAVRLVALVLVALGVGALRRHEEATRTDTSTGLLNEEGFRERTLSEAYRARRYGRTLTVACIEVDGFRALTSRFGHAAGEALVRSMAHTLAGRIRASDVLAHLGADRFALLLPETAADAARIALDQFQGRLDEALTHSRWPVTFSVGAATFVSAPETAQTLVDRALACLRTARETGPGHLHHEVIEKPAPPQAPEPASQGAQTP
jgi:diguanylate cyclase (GGDEF)-like protein